MAGVWFEMWSGKCVSIVGPAGCGKTVLVRILAGLTPASGGEVRLGWPLSSVKGLPPGPLVLFQQCKKSSLPWRSVADNVQFGLANQRLRGVDQRHRIGEAFSAVNLEDFAGYYPHQLSGGMQQRAALARALACRRQIFLMNEPFSSVDALTRADLQDLTLRLWEERRQTVLLVSHDVEELCTYRVACWCSPAGLHGSRKKFR